MSDDKMEDSNWRAGAIAGEHAASQAEQPMKDGELEKLHAQQRAYAMEAMARDHDARAALLREGANAIRAKAGLPEHV